MKNKNGFTLVELLAVIVILAIIMIIAIPSVLGTMTVARQKTFIEFMEKAYTTTQKKIAEEQMLGKSYATDTAYLFNIKKDLGLSSTGNYVGVVTYYKYNDGNADYYVTVMDDEYGMFWNFSWGIPEPDSIKKDMGVEYRFYSASEFTEFFKSIEIYDLSNATLEDLCSLYVNLDLKEWIDWTGNAYDVAGNHINCIPPRPV